ncbi:MAG: hypothetical protein IJN19_07310 [Opitutales bacterium]|nr:hypothetical protein [Opitutales bacterium]
MRAPRAELGETDKKRAAGTTHALPDSLTAQWNFDTLSQSQVEKGKRAKA